ncbi:cytochrome P450 monooxygenase-like protein [Phaeosphaeriaceae sp. SRC1lsM3a]|nr:cytochrome P450 monooxygenase-like protein [Stagonospora sp. SRC1lsM3a]
MFGAQHFVFTVGTLAIVTAAYSLYVVIYELFFHPLRHIPGPFFARICGVPYALHMRDGSMVAWVKQVHDKYGDAVRLAPNEVSFTSGESAWPDIYGFRTGKYKNTGAYSKDRSWFPTPLKGVYTLLGNDEADHSRVRRNVSHAFSDKALREQEPLIQQYVDLLVNRLGEQAAGDGPIDIMRWYNYTTFDVICDLAFGEPLYCLRDSKEHNWIALVMNNLKSIGLLSVRNKYPMFAYYDHLKNYFKDTAAIARARLEFWRITSEKVTKRLEKGTDRPDFFSFIMKNQESGKNAISRDEMDANAVLFLVAGSETTATTLTGTTYLLLNNPDKYTKLVHEIRSTFSSANDITMEEVNKLEYMIACFQEGQRCYPAVPTGFPRLVPSGGGTISGHYIPEGTAVYMSQHAANHSTRNFKDPESYVPERWLGDEKYQDDIRDVVNPFSFGPRNCVGKNLAYAEMRLILAKVLFNFDIELVDKKQDWMAGQKVFTLWDKPSLMIRLRPVHR